MAHKITRLMFLAGIVSATAYVAWVIVGAVVFVGWNGAPIYREGSRCIRCGTSLSETTAVINDGEFMCYPCDEELRIRQLPDGVSPK